MLGVPKLEIRPIEPKSDVDLSQRRQLVDYKLFGHNTNNVKLFLYSAMPIFSA